MDGIEWKQYEPPPAAGELVKRQGKGHNSASISVFVRSIMAKEWARALGKKPGTNPIGRGGKDGLYGSR